MRIPSWGKPAIAGLVVGAIATRYPQVLGLGDEAIHDAIEQLFELELLLLVVAKLLAACICRGFGFPGGVFWPALFLGAMLGSALGQTFQGVHPELVSSVPVYALAGMGAVISCVTGAPLTTILNDVLAANATDATHTVSRIASMPGIVLQVDDSLDDAMRQLRYFVGVSVPVVDHSERMRLLGVCFQSSIIGAYNDAVEQARAEERGAD